MNDNDKLFHDANAAYNVLALQCDANWHTARAADAVERKDWLAQAIHNRAAVLCERAIRALKDGVA